MARRVVRLTVDGLRSLPAPLRECLCWELPEVLRDRVEPEQAAAEKEAWLSEVLRDWGSCGRLLLVEEEPAGLVVYVPAAFAPGAARWPTAPVSPDAVLMTTVYVAPQLRGGGLGRVLVQAMAGDLIKRGGVRAVESFGAHTLGPGAGCPAGCAEGCLLAAGFLEAVGFRTQRPHPSVPRMRMDLRATVRWRGEVEQALDRLVGAVRPPAPVVAPRALAPGTLERLRPR